MKRILKMTALAFLVMLGSTLHNKASAQYYEDDDYDNYDNNNQYERGDVSYQTFYDELSPHGRWVEYPDYGYVWVPNAGPDFQPYSTNGRWVWTDDYEWMWVSDYSWGWAPFHYGRWAHDAYYGWYWVPGYEWSPAWVAWRDGGDYYGWAPLRPGINVSINFSIGSYAPPVDYWCFAPRRYIASPRIYDYCVPRRQNVTIINQTTIINNYNYNRNVFRTGPRRMDVERYTGRINPVRFRDTRSPGRAGFRNNEVTVYRPSIQRDNNNRFAPRQFERVDRTTGNRTTVRNDNNNNGFRRDNPNRRNETAGNNLPRPERDNNRFRNREQNNGQPGGNADRRFERQRNPSQDRPVNGNNLPDRRFERRDNPVNTQPGNTNPNRERVFRPRERQEAPSNNNGNMDNRRFERRMDNGGSQRQIERRPEVNQPQRQQQPSRQFERRGENRQPAGNNGNGNGRSRRF